MKARPWSPRPVTGSGDYKFPLVQYTEPGTHNYIVKEKKGTMMGMRFDKTVYSFTVEVTVGEDGVLVTNITGDDAKALDFTNEYEKPEHDNPHLPETGFSASHPQVLPQQPKDLQYRQLSWRLEIPTLELTTDIVEVPYVDGEFPVTWLGDSAGLLEGYSLPGQGHSIITGHNHLNEMEDGPFALITELDEGDRIFVTDPRNRLQIFEVYMNAKIEETDFESLWRIADLEDLSLTLITCEDERTEGGYANRRIIAAKPVK